MARFPTLKSSWPWPWPWSYCIPSCITHRPLPTYQISLKSKKRFVDGRTYASKYVHKQTDGRTRQLRPALLGWLYRRVDPKCIYPLQAKDPCWRPCYFRHLLFCTLSSVVYWRRLSSSGTRMDGRPPPDRKRGSPAADTAWRDSTVTSR